MCLFCHLCPPTLPIGGVHIDLLDLEIPKRIEFCFFKETDSWVTTTTSETNKEPNNLPVKVVCPGAQAY